MLTPKQEQYCKNRALKKMSQRKAYLDAYPQAKEWQPNTVDARACELERESKIIVRIKELQDELKEDILKEAAWTRQDAFDTLKKLIDTANEEMGFADKISMPCVRAIVDAVKELNGIFDVTAETTDKQNDGFIDALNGQAKEVWNDEENGDIPI